MLEAVHSKNSDQEDAKSKIEMQSVSIDIWDKKYRLKSKDGNFVDQTIEDTYERVAEALADVEPKDKKTWKENFLGTQTWSNTCGRITSNAGAKEHKPATSTINCTVSGAVQDSMTDILDKVHEAGLTLKAGCGIGYEFSTLRPKGAFVAGAGAYTAVLYRSWIFMIVCVSRFQVQAEDAELKWLRLIFLILTSLTSLKQKEKMAASGNLICPV